jgi:putative transposase
MRIPRMDYQGAVHHVYGRGNGKQALFRDAEDNATFLRRLLQYQQETGITILAYCLMVNHYHLVTCTGKVPLSAFMHRLLTSYARLFNDRWSAVGHVYQGRHDPRLCKTDTDVRIAIRYTHLNPVEAGMVQFPSRWEWSSYAGIVSGRAPIVNVGLVREFFGSTEEFEAFHASPQAKYERRPLERIALELAGSNALSLLHAETKSRDIVALRRAFAEESLEEGYRRSAVAKFLGLNPSTITRLLDANCKNQA